MNLLDTASLVVTPNGYKASKLYSIIPSDGTGDMTFARTGDTATRVNSSGLIETVLADKPRLDYLGSTCPKLLLEPQRSNLLTYSDQFNDASWTKSNSTISANAVIAPDGTTTADKIIEGTGYSTFKTIKTVSGGNQYYTFSIFAKQAESNRHIYMECGNAYVSVNLATGTTFSGPTTFSTGWSNPSVSIISYSNNWYKISLTALASASITTFTTSLYVATLTGGGGGIVYTGNGTSGIYIWGAQLESGAYATSYIPTNTASVTRIADSCLKTGISSLIGQTEGTLFIQYNSSAINVDGRILALSNGAFNNRIVIAEDTGRIRVVIYTSNTLQVDLGYSSNLGSYTGNHKIAVSYANNYLIVYVDGVLKASVNTLTVPACNSIYIGNLEDGTNVTSINGRVSSVALWKTRLQNSELATLTSL